MIDEIMIWFVGMVPGAFLMLLGFTYFQHAILGWYIYGASLFIVGLILIVGTNYIFVRDMLDNRKQKESENE